MNDQQVFVGIDVGTQGVRAVAHTISGDLVAADSSSFDFDSASWEQDPELWWQEVLARLQNLAAGMDTSQSIALSVTSTSGTVIPLDRDWHPIHPALMYRDPRSQDVARRLKKTMTELPVNSSWGLPKMIWFTEKFPEKASKIHAWRHAADFITGRLTGEWEEVDQTTALKSGYDPVSGRWPAKTYSAVGLDVDLLPLVGMSGKIVGSLRSSVARQIGLPSSTVVTLGMTDGCSSQVASGAVDPGAWNSTIGTTLVVKGTMRERVEDPLGRVYNHQHPDGWWMPGAASNVGAGWIKREYPDKSALELDRMAADASPSGGLSYPLDGVGERFPFLSDSAQRFAESDLSGKRLYAASLEGVAYVERMSFELIEHLTGAAVTEIATAGGGSRGSVWLQIRSNVLGKALARVKHANAATGAAIVAASRTTYSSLREAAKAMIQCDLIVEPNELREQYDHEYRRFRRELTQRGFVEPSWPS